MPTITSSHCYISIIWPVKYLRNYIQHVTSQIFAKKVPLKIRIILRTFEPKMIKQFRTLRLGKNHLVLIRKESVTLSFVLKNIIHTCTHKRRRRREANSLLKNDVCLTKIIHFFPTIVHGYGRRKNLYTCTIKHFN